MYGDPNKKIKKRQSCTRLKKLNGIIAKNQTGDKIDDDDDDLR